MARNLRIEYPGAIYHVTSRMIGDWQVDRSRLFRDDADRQRFLERLAERVKQYQVRLYLYCLMANHFHLVCETPAGNLSRFMQSLTTAYTVYYNLRHRRHGHLLDGRFKSKLVEGDEYLLGLSRYVHLNPVCAGVVKEKPYKEKVAYLRAYAWSSYRSYIGQVKEFKFVQYGPILSEMGGAEREWPRRYRAYVERGLVRDDRELKLAMGRSARSIGSDAFRKWIDELHRKAAGNRRRPEDISFRHLAEYLSSAIVLETLAKIFRVREEEFRRQRRNGYLRAVAARFLIRHAGQTEREAAGELGLSSGSTVSKQLGKLDGKLLVDHSLQRRIKAAEEQLEEKRHAAIMRSKNDDI